MSDNIFKKAIAFENKKQFWEASVEYQQVLEKLNKNKGSKKSKVFCKNKIRQINIQNERNFLKNHQITEIKTEDIRKIIDPIVNKKYISEVLDVIGRNSLFFPKFDSVSERSRRTMPVSYNFVNLSTQDSSGNFLKGGNDPYLSWFSKCYAIEQDLICNIFLNKIFREIIDNKKLNKGNLSKYFFNKGVFSDGDSRILDIAIDKFFNADYVSFLHILVPRFEKIFLDINTNLKLDIDTIAVSNQKGGGDSIWIQDKTLGETFFDSEDIRNIWGDDFCEQIKFVFFSQLGFKLRHKIAHGYSIIAELNYKNSVLVLYFFIVLSNRVGVKVRTKLI